MNLKNITILSVSTIFGIGCFPYFSGTLSCVLGLILFIFVKSKIVFFLLALTSTVLAFGVSGTAEKILNEKDSKKIVIDDFSGMLLTFAFVPKTPVFVISGFFLFRMLDMIKIPPADRLEKCSGSKGVVGDDLVAAIYANFILQVLRLLLRLSF